MKTLFKFFILQALLFLNLSICTVFATEINSSLDNDVIMPAEGKYHVIKSSIVILDNYSYDELDDEEFEGITFYEVYKDLYSHLFNEQLPQITRAECLLRHLDYLKVNMDGPRNNTEYFNILSCHGNNMNLQMMVDTQTKQTLSSSCISSGKISGAKYWIFTYGSDKCPFLLGEIGGLQEDNRGCDYFLFIPRDGYLFTYILASSLEKTPFIEQYQYVDLGLSVKWADANVDATDIDDFGSCFSWGETNKKEYYSSTNYNFKNNSGAGASNTISTVNDAARKNMGGQWRMPTYEECKELIDNCDYEWVVIEDLWDTVEYGARFTSRINGHSILMPAAGWGGDGKGEIKWNNSGELGFYWTSSLSSNDCPYALFLSPSGATLTSDISIVGGGWKGFVVRGVIGNEREINNNDISFSIPYSKDTHINSTISRYKRHLYWDDTHKGLTESECQKYLGNDMYQDYSNGQSLMIAGGTLKTFGLLEAAACAIFILCDWDDATALGYGIAAGICWSFGAIMKSVGKAKINRVINIYNLNHSAISPSIHLSPSIIDTHNNQYALGATVNLRF